MGFDFSNLNFENFKLPKLGEGFNSTPPPKEAIRQMNAKLWQTLVTLHESGAQLFEKIYDSGKTAFASLKKSYEDFNSAPSIQDYSNATFGAEWKSYFDNFNVNDFTAAFAKYNKDARNWVMQNHESPYPTPQFILSLLVANTCFKIAITKDNDKHLALSAAKSILGLTGGMFIAANLYMAMQEAGMKDDEAFFATAGSIAAPDIIKFVFNAFRSTSSKESNVAQAKA